MSSYTFTAYALLLLGAAIVLFIESYLRPGPIEKLRPLAFGLVALAAAVAATC